MTAPESPYPRGKNRPKNSGDLMTVPGRPWKSRIAVPDGTILDDDQCRETAVRLAGRAVERKNPGEITDVLEACGVLPYESGRNPKRYVFGGAS